MTPTDRQVPRTTSRREFIAGTGAATLALSLRYAKPARAQDQAALTQPYGRWEDLMRKKWTWDRVVRGTHGTNCTGNCAFNVYVKNGVVWREEQQGEYGKSASDVPDYGPRGCQKGLRHAKYMYGKQRILYPLKRVGERGEAQWQRVGWDQALSEIADRFIDYSVAHGPRSISFDLGTQMVLKRSAFAALGRFATITGVELPEAFAGVGDLPTGVHMTVGNPLLGDSMAAIFKSRCCLIWYCNPAVTRIPDAHFFWEARYNGTNVIAISPEFTPTAMHASKWVNPKPATDAALALAMAQVIISDKRHDAAYVREQTDLPLLVRTDTRQFLRETDLLGSAGARDNVFYIWDERQKKPIRAPGSGITLPKPGEHPVESKETLALGELRPALEGRWKVQTAGGIVEVTPVFELLKRRLRDYTPEKAAAITGVHADVIRELAREFATAKPAMIFTGYRMCKWLHGDLLQRSFMLLLSLTGNLGPAGGGLQLTNLAKEDGYLAYMFAGLPPTLRVATAARWDYVHGDLKEINAQIYGATVAEHVDRYFQESVQNRWFPDYSQVPWKMAVFSGSNAASWRSSGSRFREKGLGEVDTIVAIATDMGVTPLYADYVLPAAHHYERQDFMLEPRTPYVQVLDAAVPPLAEAVDDWTFYDRLAAAVSRRAAERGVAPIQDEFFGQPVPRDLAKAHELFSMGGKIRSTRDAIQFLIDNSSGVPKVPFADMASRGIMRNEDSDGVVHGRGSPYNADLLRSYEEKKPYPTLTGRQQYYIDHPWFMAEDEALPRHKDPLRINGYPLQFLMGHVRHGIHSMWRDDPLMLNLQRGEPDVYVNPEDARARGVRDGQVIRVFNNFGAFLALAHVSGGIQPGMVFMYHGWDPLMFRGRQNFGAVIPTAGLIKPTNLVGNYGHIVWKPLGFEPNATFHDFTCDFESHAATAPA
jgi:DMSO reductase family type II enzyme molybdopterin subunit